FSWKSWWHVKTDQSSAVALPRIATCTLPLHRGGPPYEVIVNFSTKWLVVLVGSASGHCQVPMHWAPEIRLVRHMCQWGSIGHSKWLVTLWNYGELALSLWDSRIYRLACCT